MSQADPVADRLRKAPVTPAVRAEAWDAFHAATDLDDLTKRLTALQMPDAVKADLWDLKASAAPTQTPPASVEPSAPAREATTGEAVGGKTGAIIDAGIGAIKGVGNTVFGLGKFVRDYTPIGRISDAILPGAFDQRPEEITPQNTAQRVGFTGEQVGEFLLPISKVSKLGRVGDVARSVVQTMVQSGSPLDAGVSGVVTAATPVIGKMVGKAASALKSSAEKSAAQALGATKEWAKAEAADVAPEMIRRGVKGSREAMLERAKAEAKTIGLAIDDVIQDAAERGTIVDGKVARQSIQAAQKALMTPTSNGKMIPIEGTQAALKKLQRLDRFVEQLGPAIPIEQAHRVRMAWDKIVSKAGLYGPKATASATDNADAWAIREAATSFRKLLADASPDLAMLNKEYAFWGGLRNVLKETQKRTQSQGGGLVSGVTGATGAAAGFASGDSMSDSLEKALVGGVVGRQVVRLIQSPWFRTSVSAPLKDRLAEALASQNAGRIMAALSKITAAVPAQVRTASTQ